MNIEAEYTDENAPVLKIATDYDFCSNSYVNKEGKMSGLYIEVMTEVANRLGVKPVFETSTWMGCRRMLEEGEEDVLLGLEIFSNFESSAAGAYDLVLLDIMMPVMNGLKAAEKIRTLSREDAKSIPIIAMTANAFEEDRRKTKEAGMNGHLTKPINSDKLLELLPQYKK